MTIYGLSRELLRLDKVPQAKRSKHLPVTLPRAKIFSILDRLTENDWLMTADFTAWECRPWKGYT
jgi:hypothetical protein